METAILHTVQITDTHGFLDSVPVSSRAEAYAVARKLYSHRDAAPHRWACFLATYTKQGTYSHLDRYELIPQA